MPWSQENIGQYQQFSKNYIENFHEKIDCADLAIVCLVDFASQNSLPVKLKYLAGGWKWYSFAPGVTNAVSFKDKATRMLGALNVIDNTKSIQIADAQPGDLIMTKWNASLGHTRIIYEIKKDGSEYKVIWYQGNLPPVVPEKREGYFSQIANVFGNRPRRWNFAQFS